jgi:hypothetical protein
METRFRGAKSGDCSPAFTLVEMLVSMGVLVMLIVMINVLFGSAETLTSQANKHMDADAQARAVFDRMAIDFSQIVRRRDVDYWLKDSVNNKQPGNDQIAFYSQVPGYFLTSNLGTSAQSPMSLVAYRIYQNQLQRYGCGLAWNGIAGTGSNQPLIFSIASTSYGNGNAIYNNWPNATNNTNADSNYESIGPQVFRMEYYYLVQSGTNPTISTADAPWDTRTPPGHTSVNGLSDLAAISVTIAVIDSKSQMLVSSNQLATLAGSMKDYQTGSMAPGALESLWETQINSSALPKAAISAIRVYRRDFYLPK